MEKVPIKRQHINLRPKKQETALPKRFLKKMEKNMKRNNFGQGNPDAPEEQEEDWVDEP